MRETAHAWLPQSALGSGAAEAALAGVVEQWCRKWIAGPPLRPIGAASEAPLRIPANDAERWDFVEPGLYLGIGAAGEAALAAAMLGLAKSERPSTAADAAVTARLASSCLADLRSRLAKMLQLPADRGWQRVEPAAGAVPEGYGWTIGGREGQPVIRLFFSRECFVGLVRMAAAPPPPPPRLRPLDEALSSQPVGLAALVGACELPLSEIAGLAAGDVLVLDRDLDEPLAIAVGGAVRGGRCKVEQSGERLVLHISEPPCR